MGQQLKVAEANRPQRKGPQGARAEMKRKAITDAALALFLSEGPAVNLDRVSEAANVSKVTIYNHFESKDALLLEVVRVELIRAHEATLKFISCDLASSHDLAGALGRLSRIWVAGLTSPSIMRLRAIVISHTWRLPELGRAWIEFGPDRLHPHIAGALRTLEPLGLSIPDMELAVLHLAGLVVSPHVMYGPFGCEPDAATTERVIDSGVELFLARYGAPTA